MKDLIARILLDYPARLGRCAVRAPRHVLLLALLGLPLATLSTVAAESTAVAPSATQVRLTGRVQHGGTKQFLTGATVDLLGQNQSTLTDTLGRFEFRNLAPGSYTVSVSYTGLDSQEQTVELNGSTGADPLLVTMLSEVYKLETFQVTTEKEGHAAAITRQRNSTNVITAAATDAFGALASQNPGEIFMRLPGVAATIDDDGQPSAVSIRGMASRLNSVSTDGGMLAPVSSGATRQVRFTTNSTAQYEELEIVKGIRPDMDGSSVGGTLNMKTKSPLKSALDHEVTYKVGARWAPPFAEHNPTRRDRSINPDLAFSYNGVYDILGGKRNFALSFNTTYFESVGDYARTTRDYEFTTNSRAYVWDYQAADYYFNRKLKTFSGRADYQLSPSTLISFRGAMNYYDAWGGHLFNQARAFTSRTVASVDVNGNPTGTGAILPSYTDTVTEVRPVAASQFSLSSNSIGQLQEQRSFQLVLEHHKDRLELDINLNYALGRLSQMSGQHGDRDNGGSFSATVAGVGYKIDMTDSVEYPEFTQTAGPNVYDISNYKNGTLTQTGSRRDAHIQSARLDAKYELDTRFPAYIKAGFNIRRQDSKMETKDDRSMVYVGPDGLANTGDETLAPFLSKLVLDSDYRLGALPLINVSLLAENLESSPGSWNENLYYREQRRRTGTNSVTEDVPAGYLMANAKIGKLTALGGVRYEYTSVKSQGWVKTDTRADLTDPVQRVSAEYSVRNITGNYDNVLPSLHLSYALRPNLTARASWSTGLGRPEFSNLVPVESVNTTSQTVTISNPALLPQGVTNWDLGLEYYQKPMGLLSVAVFQKDLTDFQFSATNGLVGTGADNGFGGNYAGYTVNTTLNGGSARVRGLELSWQQQVNFGPEWMRKLGVFANYTRIRATGDYGTGSSQGVTQLAEFVPETWNVGLRFSRGRFRCNYLVNYTSEYLFAYSSTEARQRYKNAFKQTTVSTSWALRSNIEVYADAYNVFNKPQSYYYGVKEHMQAYSIKGMIISLGVRGRF